MASLLKLYLRQLPEPLVPFSHYQEFLFCGQKLLSERTLVTVESLVIYSSSTTTSNSPSLGLLAGPGGAEESSLRVAVRKLQLAQIHLPVRPPPPWFLHHSLCLSGIQHPTFIYICVSRFLYEVQSFSSSNRMSIQILATVFGPNILRAKAEDPQKTMGGKWKDKQKSI